MSLMDIVMSPSPDTSVLVCLVRVTATLTCLQELLISRFVPLQIKPSSSVVMTL